MPALASKIMVKVSSDVGEKCPLCDFFMKGSEQWQEACNHLLAHGLKCIHVGQESMHDNDGKLYHNTVAVFGK
jgi:hypothetical protein